MKEVIESLYYIAIPIVVIWNIIDIAMLKRKIEKLENENIKLIITKMKRGK